MPVHPPKVETFDVAAVTNTDPKGFVRVVEDYREEPFGLYMARPMVGHPTVRYVESWLLPGLGLRVTDWWWHPGYTRDQNYYLDVCDVERDGRVWRTTDYYLDIIVHTGRPAEVIDLDEFAAALADGLLDTGAAERALASAFRACTGIAGHGHDLDAWLASHSITLTWRGGLRGTGSGR